MKSPIPIRLGIPALLLAALTLPQSALACAACFGRSDSPMAKGMNMGILSLLIIVLVVLTGIGSFFIFLMVRSARLARTNSETVSHTPTTASSTL